MKPNLGKVLEACIESGIEQGWRIAHKNDDAPTEYDIKDAISEAIWYELYSWFDFKDKEND
jgi:hypothetical protein